MKHHVVLTYAEVKGLKTIPTYEDLLEIISRLDQRSTFQLLSVISNLLSILPPSADEKEFVGLQATLATSFLDEETRILVDRRLRGDTLLRRPIFHRWQALYLMKLVALAATEKGGLVPSATEDLQARYSLGQACLIANDLLSSASTDTSTEMVPNFRTVG